MRSRRKYISFFLALGLFAIIQVGCSKSPTLSEAPSDEEAVTAIKAFIQTTPITALSPIQILEKGKRGQIRGRKSLRVPDDGGQADYSDQHQR